MTTKADTAAAERLLKAAVKRAREEMALIVLGAPYEMDRDDVENMLRAAGESAELLLEGSAS